jgi:tetratricopeptide (TPR) repeat protein
MRTLAILISLVHSGCMALNDPPLLSHGEAYLPDHWLDELSLPAEANQQLQDVFADGLRSHRKGEIDHSRDRFESACLLSPTPQEQSICKTAEALVLIDDQKFAEAIRLLDEAISLNPLDWRPVFHKWQSLRMKGDYDQAEQVRAIGLQMNNDVFEKVYSFKKGVI